MLKIALIDDEMIIADGFTDLFKNAFFGVEFKTFYKSRDLLEYSENNQVDILVCDIDMPVINGIKLATMLKEKNKSLKVLFLTGMNTFDYIYSSSKVEDSTYVLKMEDDDVIINKLQKLINLKNEELQTSKYYDALKELNDLQHSKIKTNVLKHVFNHEDIEIDKSFFENKSIIYFRIDTQLDKDKENELKSLIAKYFNISINEIVLIASRTYAFLYSFFDMNQDYEEKLNDFVRNVYSKFGVKSKIIYTANSYQVSEIKQMQNQVISNFLLLDYQKNFIKIFEELSLLHKTNEKDEVLVLIDKYLNEHIGAETSLIEVADYLHYNTSYLSRYFKNITGYNFKDYVRKIKLDKAKRLLLHTDMKVKDIAKTLGFESVSHFQNVFRKEENITPLEYRRSNIKQ